MPENKIPDIFEGEIYKVRKDVKDTFAGKVGARLRKEPKVADNILALMPPEEVLEIAPESIGKTGWLKVVNYGANELEGYCHDSSLEKEVVVTLKEDLCDKVNNVCMEVKAGTVIGYAGLNGFEKHEAYRAAHLEVFTADGVKDFLANSQKDGEDKKYYTKLFAGTELKVSLPVKVAKNSKVKLLSGSSENYQRVEIVNIEVTVNNRFEALGEYDSGNKTYEFLASQSDRIEAFNKVAGDIARVGDSVELLEQLEGKKRKVRHLNPASGRVFWVKKEMIEKKVITYEVPQEQDEAELGIAPEFAVMPAARELSISGEMPDSITETKDYDVLNTDLMEINILNPEFHERESRTLESDVVVNFKNGLEYSDADGKKWYLLEFKELKPNGVARYYQGLVKEEELSDKFSAYDWDKFGFRILEDVNNDYIYDFKNKSEFLKEICKLVDENKNGILEPFELQRALNNHYTVDKLSKLVCKHHSEWAYGGRYFSALEKQVEQVLQKGIDLEEDEARKQELETLKKERMAAFEAKVKQLAIWEEIESRKGSYASKFVKGALLTNPLTTGGYLTYEGVKWLYRKFRSDEEIPLSPFPVNNPVVYHFHPIAFVEGMRRMGNQIFEPIKNSLLCLYTQNGNYRPWHNVFGNVRTLNSNSKHQGVDILAKPDTEVYSCFDGVVKKVENQSGYGKVLIIEIEDIDSFVDCKKDYSLLYKDKGELQYGKGFNLNGPLFLFYAHLNDCYVSVNDKVAGGQLVASSGTTGYGSSKDPHLHFEIRNKLSAPGLSNRCNPAFFIDYKNESDMAIKDKQFQEEVAQKFWD
ncbi:M23 family metallopeptidase [Geofilum rubicundum]|nr:M23 family metallopeptidase [Geofilum rubicundum]